MKSPFTKSIREIEAKDLTILRDIAEGWYYEYKQQLIKPKDIAKSISALANTHGGWLFFGIKSAAKTHCAEEFPGLASEEIAAAEQHIRQAASAWISPVPFFEHQVVLGPEPGIGLPPGRGVIVVQIPEGVNAPYVHASGRIFRRVGDESSPKEETDRHLLDQLWDRSRNHQKKFETVISVTPHRNQIESELPIAKIYVFHNLWREGERVCRITHRKFQEVMKSGGLPFATIFPSTDSHIALQTQGNNPVLIMPQWRHRFDGCIDEITIPFNTIDLADKSRAAATFSSYKYGLQFFELCRQAGMTSGRVIDLSLGFTVMHSIMQRLEELLAIEDTQTDIYAKVQISGLRRASPFIDVPQFVEVVRDNGIPVIQDDIAYCPAGFELTDVLQLINARTATDVQDPGGEVAAVLNAVSLFARFCQAFGMRVTPTGFSTREETAEYQKDEVSKWYSELGAAAERARIASRKKI